MRKNCLERIFEEFRSKGISFCVRGRYKHLPERLDGGDVDLLIERKDFHIFLKIIEKEGFVFYPYTQPNLFYFFYDKDLGMVQLDVLFTKKMAPLKKYKNFFVPKSGKTIPNKKTVMMKIWTSFRRKWHYFFRGPLIVFEGPDGSGKSTNAEAVYNALRRIGLKKEIIHFATPFRDKKPSTFKRFYTRVWSILKVYRNVVLGKLTITDRYIYLTFRKHHPLLKRTLRFLAPTPSTVFVMKANPETIRIRKAGQRDCLSKEMIEELYEVYENIPKAKLVNADRPVGENMHLMINEILRTNF